MKGRVLWGWMGLLFFPGYLSAQGQGEAVWSGWIREAGPDLGKILGIPMAEAPKLQRASAELLRQADDQAIASHLRWRFPHLKDQAFVQALEDARTVNDSVTVARQVEGANVILVRPENQRAIAGWDQRLAGVDTGDFLKLALVQETARQALERRHDLKKGREACRDGEEWFALQAIIEGQTLWATRELARQRGLERAFPLLTERLLHVPDVSADPALRTMSQSALRQRYWAGNRGLAFFEYLHDKGWTDLDKVFAHPPRTVQLIERPDRYLVGVQQNRADPATVLQRFAGALPAQEWSFQMEALTPAMVKQVADLLKEKDRAEKVLAGWSEGRSLVWTSKNRPGQQIALSLARLESPAAARAYFGFALDLQRQRDELSNHPCGLPLRVIESHSRAIPLAVSDEAILFDKKVQLAGNGHTLPISSFLVLAGDQVLDISWHGVAADLEWAQQVAGVLLGNGQPVKN